VTGGFVDAVAQWLRDLAVIGSPSPDEPLRMSLGRFSGREWLRLDQAFRTGGTPERPQYPARHWRDRLEENPSLMVACAASMHSNGHLREYAVELLTRFDDPISSAFLAVRVSDWVRQVQVGAAAALLERTDLAHAQQALPILLAAEPRARATDFASTYRAVVANQDDTVTHLVLHRDRATAVWAIARAEDRGHLSESVLLRLAERSADQVVSEMSARTLAARDGGPSPDAAQALLASPRATVRSAALEKLPPALLDDRRVIELVYDRSASVRLLARWRFRRSGGDPAATYLQALSRTSTDAQLVGSLLGWSETEAPGRVDIGLVATYLSHHSPSVRRAAVITMGRRADRHQVIEAIVPMLEDPVRKVAAAALGQLKPYGLAVPPDTVERLMAGESSGGRRLALSVQQSHGGWERVTADLQAAAEGDPVLALAARSDLITWLIHDAATTRGRPNPDQAQSIAESLPHAGLDRRQQRSVAFHAGVHLREADEVPHDAPPPWYRFWAR
jgi:hypothetical protein